MFKKLLTNRNEETFIGVVLILLLIIAFYNWIIALLACIVIGGVYVLTHKTNTERNREISQLFRCHFPECRSGFDLCCPESAYRHRHSRYGIEPVLGEQRIPRLGR